MLSVDTIPLIAGGYQSLCRRSERVPLEPTRNLIEGLLSQRVQRDRGIRRGMPGNDDHRRLLGAGPSAGAVEEAHRVGCVGQGRDVRGMQGRK